MLQISIIIPIFNGAKYLREAILSIQNQSDRDFQFEILLVNDGSIDSSESVCRELCEKDGRLKYIHLPKNEGVATARNTGVNASIYPWLAFCDQDDCWDKDRIKIQKRFISSAESFYILGYQDFFLDGIEEYPRWFKSSWSKSSQKGYLFSTLLISKATFLKIGALNPTLRAGGDDVEWFSRAKSSGIQEIMCEEVILHRRLHAHNASQHTEPANRELLKIIREKVKRVN